MTIELAERTETTSDPVHRVHHHTTKGHVTAGLRGEPIPMLCGVVKAGGPKGWGKPCCPMCALVLVAHGHTCQVGEAA